MPIHLDLAGLREEYVAGEEVPPASRRLAVLGWVVGLSFPLALVVVVAVAGDGDVRWGPLVAAPLVALALARRQSSSRHRLRTRLTATHLDLRERTSVDELLAWDDVLVVTAHRAQRRSPGEVHLRDGRRLRLVGMPADDVVRLAEALDRARAAAATEG